MSSINQQTSERDKEVERVAGVLETVTTSVKEQECADHSWETTAFIEPEKEEVMVLSGICFSTLCFSHLKILKTHVSFLSTSTSHSSSFR